ncbi:MAG: FAD-binding domain-containing protein [Candidatus Sericytochromatia bacterium]|nr:FAD-binding domain-containing protein [Candidatus Sericytochromatia bacterium]
MQLSLFDRTLPHDETWRRRLRGVDPKAYARTRNSLDGRVTGLSPFITHGFVAPREILATLAERGPLTADDKLVMELGWREFFHHVWEREGARIFRDLRPPVWPGAYARQMPADVLAAASGVPAIDQAVQTLHHTGHLHNHARMWLASYLVHLRKVHWSVGAAWMYAHLLDGDLASNSLSWQWVAGTFSSKPYLFNGANVARYAPASWHSPGTAIDTDYDRLAQLAREAGDVGPEPGERKAADQPENHAVPPLALWDELFVPLVEAGEGWWKPRGEGPRPLREGPWELLHPWDLRSRSALPAWRLGVLHLPFHARFPWSTLRWRFVLTRLASLCDAVWIGDLASLKGLPAGTTATASLNPGYAEHLPQLARLRHVARFTPNPARTMRSFSQFWEVARDQLVWEHGSERQAAN